jgi:hypothetical protein
MSDIEALRENMREMSEKLDALPSVDEKPKTALEILERNKRENYWNSLLRYFLDPNEPHGMGTDLLEATLNRVPEEQFYFDGLELEDANVISEAQTEDGRPDIVVYTEGDWLVLFELKVESGERTNQTEKYAESDEVAGMEKDDFEEGCTYVFLSKRDSSDASADEFVDMCWLDVIGAIDEVLTNSRGSYTAKATAQLNDFRDSIKSVIRMTNKEDQRILEEKTKLYAEHYEDIEKLEDALDRTRKREKDRWYERLVEEFEPEGWTDEWNCYPSKWGQIYRDDWWLDENGNQTDNWGELTYFVHFRSLFWHERHETFSEGKFQFNTITNNDADDDYRSEFRQLLNNKYRDEIKEIVQDLDKNINYKKSGDKTRTEYNYTFDATEGPDGFYETLSEAVEEHLKLAPIITEVHETAVERVTDGEITF